MLFCPKCGTQNPDGAAFCGSCGESLQGFAGQAPANQGAQAGQRAPYGATPKSANAGYAGAGAGVGAPGTPGAHSAVRGARASKLPLIIGVVVAALVVAALVIFVIPRCSGGVAGGGADLHTLNTAKASDAQATLKKMASGEIDAGSESIAFYASSDKMVSFVEDLVEDIKSGDVNGWDDILDAKTAKDLNGEWVLLSMADDDLQDALQVDGLESVYDMSHMALWATVVADDDLTNEEVAKLVAGAGLSYDHATVADMKTDDVFGLIGDYMSVLAGAGMSSSGMSSISGAENAIDDAGVNSIGMGTYLGKDQIGASVSLQCEGYAVVALWCDDPSNIEGFDKIYNEDYLKRLYVK